MIFIKEMEGWFNSQKTKLSVTILKDSKKKIISTGTEKAFKNAIMINSQPVKGIYGKKNFR